MWDMNLSGGLQRGNDEEEHQQPTALGNVHSMEAAVRVQALPVIREA
jgi:hypothetical protein